jgi:hypothetical protein
MHAKNITSLFGTQHLESKPFLLGHARVNTDRWKVAFNKKLVEFSSPADALNKDDNLVEIKSIQ